MLIAEEPELYLHPQARRIISAEFDKFLKNSVLQARQIIISTHSTEYLKNVDPYNIVRVYKDLDKNCSIAKQLGHDISLEITKELKRFLWSNNTELFFADKVVLVEGGEVYLVPAFVDKLKGAKQLLDYKNITVSRVNGKGNFLPYVKMLQSFNIEYIILGDLDCFKDEVPKLVKHLKIEEISESVSKITAAISELKIKYESINERIKGVDKNHDAQTLQDLFEKFSKGEIEKGNEDLLGIIQFMQLRYTKGNKEKAIIDSVGLKAFEHVLSILREKNIFIWSKGDLESYYSPKSKALMGSKDIKALELSYLLQKDEQDINELFVNVGEIALLANLIINNPINPPASPSETEQV